LIIFAANCSAFDLFSFFIDSDISIRSLVVPLVAEQTTTILLFFDNEVRYFAMFEYPWWQKLMFHHILLQVSFQNT